MSSRALRRVQRELEEESLRRQADEADEEDGEDAEGLDVVTRPVKKSAFELLNTTEENDGDDSDDDVDGDNGAGSSLGEQTTQVHDDDEEDEEAAMAESEAGKSAKKQKKKKKKKSKAKGKAAKEQTDPALKAEPDLDEIDLALKSLGTSKQSEAAKIDLVISRELSEFYRLLSTDKQHLNALNEMKKLFGNVVLERDSGEEDAAARRQRNNQGVAISDFISARYSKVSRGQGLSGLALRQNAFMAGKPEWPKTASGGLSMELVERADDFTTEYRFLHNSMYQHVQKDFERAVQTYDPQAIFQMVYNNPYHISSLLQMAEILRHQGDHSMATDLYERALYNFGRSVQSTFASALSEGKARMDFRRPENREFWLTAFRYIGALIQKGTFRTAYEWAKLLLSLDPEGDPYCVRLIIDQLALKGGQSQHLIDLANIKTSLIDWGQDSPNIRISLALARHRVKQIDEAKRTLHTAIMDFPWIFARMFQELDVQKTPKSIWGIQPRTDLEKFQMESCVARTKDIWNTPESLSFLQEAVEDVRRSEPPKDEGGQVSLDEARHALVSEIQSLISAVPREYTTMRTTSSDPLPPPDSMPSYDLTDDRFDLESDGEDAVNTARQGAMGEIGQAQRDLQQAIRDHPAAGGGVMGLLGRALNLIVGRGATAGSQAADAAEAVEGAEGRPEESLGRQMGMEEVTVRTIEEYEQALNNNQWPVIDPDAEAEIMRGLQRVDLANPASARAREATAETSAAEERSRNEREAAAVLEAQSRRQATVEDADDDDGDGEPVEEATSRTSAAEAGQQASVGPMSRAEITEALRRDYDNESNKRWLAGRGMLALKTFVGEHGTDETKWMSDPRVDKAPVTEYLARVPLLNSNTDRNFILDYALKQGAGAPASEMIRRML